MTIVADKLYAEMLRWAYPAPGFKSALFRR